MAIFDLTSTTASPVGEDSTTTLPRTTTSSATVTPSATTPNVSRSNPFPILAPGATDDAMDAADEEEIDAYCSFCDRQIIAPRPVMSGPEKKVTVTDANGVPQFIAPIPARLPGKKASKAAAGGKSHLKRNHTSTRLQQLAAAAASAVQQNGLPRPVPIEPPRPASTSAPDDTRDYNVQLYCSSACARADERRANELEEQMNALWLQQTSSLSSSRGAAAAAGGRPGVRRLSSGATSVTSYAEPPSPLWLNTRGLAHASGSSDGGSSSNDVLASPHADDASAAAAQMRNDALGDYFDMAQTGVERGLIARERRRSQAGGKAPPGRSSSGSIGGGPLMQRLGSNQSTSSITNTGYGYRANPISSSDSLSSMWSSSASEGRTFSDDPATTTGGQPSRPVIMRGLTPLTAHTSNPTSPVLISRGSFSGARSSAGTAPFSAPLRRDSMPVSSSNGSANAASLFSDYASNFHRVAASSDLHPSPRLQAVADKPRRDSSVETYATRRAEFDDVATSLPRPRAGSSSAEPRIARGRGEFSPALLDVAPSSHDGSHSTPTQSLVRDPSSHLAIGSAGMARSDSRESRGSSHTGSDGSGSSMRNAQGVHIHRKSTIKASSARQLSFSLSSKYSTPTRALSIGDDVVLQPSMETDLSRSYTVRPRLPARADHPSEPSSYKDSSSHMRAAIAPALAHDLNAPRREWSYESLEQAGRKMYQLPVKAIAADQTSQRLFRFAQ